MTENEFLLNDRIAKITSIISQYGEDNFYIAFSGGKDSTVLSELIDLALPNNKSFFLMSANNVNLYGNPYMKNIED